MMFSAVMSCALILHLPMTTAAQGTVCKAEDKKEFETMSEGQTGGYLATYVAKYEPNLGAEFAQYPSKEYTDTYRTDVLYYGLSKDGKEYTALNNNKAILSPAGCTKLGSPSLFRKADGTYGLIAAVDNTTDRIIVFYSDDLLYFYNQNIRKLNNDGIVVMNPTVKYTEGTSLYDIFWEGGDGKSYVTATEDFESFSEPVETSYEKASVNAALPDYASAEEASVFELTQEEYDRVSKKYDKLRSVAVDVNDIQIKPGEEAVLPDKVDVVYSDGSKTPMGIEWKTNGLNLKNLAVGEYTVTGEIQATTEYNSPLALYRADPYAIYDEEKGVYYFTGSDMNEKSASGGGAYDAVVLRQAETLNDIADAEEIEIWRNETSEDGTKVTGWFWAPELHKIGDKWRIIVQGQVTEPGESKSSTRQCIFSCNGDDLMNADNWEKYPFPILSTPDLTTTVKKADYSLTDGTDKVTGHGDSGLLPEGEGEYIGTFGPGHNSFTIDENGNPVIVYHARDWEDSYPGATGDAKYGLVDPGRHAYAKHVVFNYEGFPVCNLSPEEYLASSLRTVIVKISVLDGKTDAGNTGNNDGGKPPVNNPVDFNNDNSKNELVNVKAGDTKTIGNAKYTVLSVSASGKGTVAFSGVTKKTIKKITVKSTHLKNVGKNAFKETSKKLRITVPKKKFKAYKKIFKQVKLK